MDAGVVFERVYVEHEWYDGPLRGIADCDGKPHYFATVFDVDADEWAYNVVRLWPVDEATLEREIEAWHLFVALNDRRAAGKAPSGSHSGLQGMTERDDELKALLTAARTEPAGADQRTATWQFDDGGQRYTMDGPSYRVAWSPIH